MELCGNWSSDAGTSTGVVRATRLNDVDIMEGLQVVLSDWRNCFARSAEGEICII